MNAKQALKNYLLWLTWHKDDFKGATEFASDYLETESDVIELQQLIKGLAQ